MRPQWWAQSPRHGPTKAHKHRTNPQLSLASQEPPTPIRPRKEIPSLSLPTPHYFTTKLATRGAAAAVHAPPSFCVSALARPRRTERRSALCLSMQPLWLQTKMSKQKSMQKELHFVLKILHQTWRPPFDSRLGAHMRILRKEMPSVLCARATAEIRRGAVRGQLRQLRAPRRAPSQKQRAPASG